jgi:hypothetical protein
VLESQALLENPGEKNLLSQTLWLSLWMDEPFVDKLNYSFPLEYYPP